ncbi:MAG: homoserine O-acetyltransferase [Chitinophagaceae bacterium]
MDTTRHFYDHEAPIQLENGLVLNDLRIAFHTFGELNEAKDNVIWICHALTANSDAADWWPGMVGPGKAFDTDIHFIVCANILGSCYGTTAARLFIDNQLPAFITIRDMVQAHIVLRQHLGIEKIQLLVGGSMGGYQSMEWALAEPAIIQRQFLLVTGAAESAWGIAIHTAQRLAIEADASWLQTSGGAKGLKAARAIGMITYRNYKQYMLSQSDSQDTEKTDDFKASSYINYQGEKLVSRFNAKSYWALTKSMDSHNIARGRGGNIGEVLAQLLQPTLIIGINSDFLCPTQEQQVLASYLPQSQLHIIDSLYGHDGFLTETVKVSGILRDWVKEGM